MQVFDQISYNEVTTINIHDTQLRSKEILSIIHQELEIMGFEETLKTLENETNFQADDKVNILKQHIISGKYSELVDMLNFEPKINEKIKYELLKQFYLEMVQKGDYQQSVLILRTLKSIQDSEEIQLLTTQNKKIFRLIFSNQSEEIQRRFHLDIDLQKQRLQLYFKCNNLLNFGTFTLETQLDKIIKEANEYQYKKCQYHSQDQINKKNMTLLNDHQCSKLSIPQHEQISIKGFDDEVWISKFSPKGNYVGCATKKNSVYIIKLPYEVQKIPKAHSKDITGLIFTQNEQQLFSCSNDSHINCYSVNEGKLELQMQLHTTPILCLQIYNNLLFSGGIDNWIGIWTFDGKLFQQIKSKIVKNILFTQKYMLIQNAASPSITIFNNDGKYQQKIEEIEEQEIIVSSTLSFDQNYILLLVGKQLPKLHLWNLQGFNKIKIFGGFSQNCNQIQCCFAGFDDSFVCIGSSNGKLILYNKNNQTDQYVINAHLNVINFVDWNHSKQILVSASDDKSIKIWGSNLVQAEHIEQNGLVVDHESESDEEDID